MGKHCCVTNCHNNSARTRAKGISYHHVPGEIRYPVIRKQWLAKINRLGKDGKVWKPKKFAFVCSKHFVDGRPSIGHPVPELNLGYKLHPCQRVKGRKPIFKYKIQPKNRPGRVAQKSQVISEPETLAESDNQQAPDGDEDPMPIVEIFPEPSGIPDTVDIEANPSEKTSQVATPETANSLPVAQICDEGTSSSADPMDMLNSSAEKKQSSKDDEVSPTALESELQALQEQVKTLEGRVSSLQKQLDEKPKCSHQDLVGDDALTRLYTGFPDYETFHSIFEKKIKKRASRIALNNKPHVQSWYDKGYTSKPGPQRKLLLKDEYLLVMMRLRLNLLEDDLAFRFGVGQSTVSRVLNNLVPCLARCLRRLIKLPPKELVRQNMPQVFKKYPKTRTIIDCTEIFIERPTSLLARQETWSNYKSHNTAKYLVCITPWGTISYISQGWGGRASDKFIVNNSGFLDTLEPYDEVMADRGFDIAGELAKRSCTLNIPPFTKGKNQLSRVEVSKHRSISSLRIHVERAIKRLKNFRILQGVFPISQIHLMNDMVTICAAVTNLWKPIVSD